MRAAGAQSVRAPPGPGPAPHPSAAPHPPPGGRKRAKGLQQVRLGQPVAKRHRGNSRTGSGGLSGDRGGAGPSLSTANNNQLPSATHGRSLLDDQLQLAASQIDPEVRCLVSFVLVGCCDCCMNFRPWTLLSPSSCQDCSTNQYVQTAHTAHRILYGIEVMPLTACQRNIWFLHTFISTTHAHLLQQHSLY